MRGDPTAFAADGSAVSLLARCIAVFLSVIPIALLDSWVQRLQEESGLRATIKLSHPSFDEEVPVCLT